MNQEYSHCIRFYLYIYTFTFTLHGCSLKYNIYAHIRLFKLFILNMNSTLFLLSRQLFLEFMSIYSKDAVTYRTARIRIKFYYGRCDRTTRTESFVHNSLKYLGRYEFTYTSMCNH